jgi:hypothetical protein
MPDVRIRRRPTDANHVPAPLPTERSAPNASAADAFAWTQRLALSLQYRPIDELKPAPRNARTHSKKQIQKIAASIGVFGFVNPILIDRDDTVVAGHGRIEAAKLLRLTEVPTIRLEPHSGAEPGRVGDPVPRPNDGIEIQQAN